MKAQLERRLLLVLVIVLLSPLAYGQGCAMCTKTAAGLDSKSAKGLNGGILYLAALPLIIMGTIGFVWWRQNKSE